MSEQIRRVVVDRKLEADKQAAANKGRLKIERELAQTMQDRLVAEGHSSANRSIPTARMPIEQLQSWIDQEEILLANRRAVVENVRAIIAKKAKALARLEKNEREKHL